MTILTVAIPGASCAYATTQMFPTSWLRFEGLVLPIPADVQQRAVLYPCSGAPDWSNTYGLLEKAVFQFKHFAQI